MVNTKATVGHMEGAQLILAHGDKELHVNGHLLILLYCSKRRNLPPFGRQQCQILQSQRDKRGHQLAVSLGTQGRLVGAQCCARLRLGG